MTKRPRKPLTALVAAPLAAAILLGMAGYTLMSYRPGGAGDAYFAQVRQAIDQLPTQIGSFHAKEQPPIPAAIDMLRPNRLLQREYTNVVTQERFSLLVVHCGDVRDMMGHFPPSCYPSAGWAIVNDGPQTIERTNGGPIPITRYRVERDIDGIPHRRVIANTFILPRADRPLGRDDRDLDSVTRTRWSSGLGAAQVQIITSAEMDDATREQIERSVADELGRVIDAVTNVSDQADGASAQTEQGEGS